jgi:hypothetical protein
MSTPYSPQHRWMKWLVDVQVASCGCDSPVCLHTSRLGAAMHVVWLFQHRFITASKTGHFVSVERFNLWGNQRLDCSIVFQQNIQDILLWGSYACWTTQNQFWDHLKIHILSVTPYLTNGESLHSWTGRHLEVMTWWGTNLGEAPTLGRPWLP